MFIVGTLAINAFFSGEEDPTIPKAILIGALSAWLVAPFVGIFGFLFVRIREDEEIRLERRRKRQLQIDYTPTTSHVPISDMTEKDPENARGLMSCPARWSFVHLKRPAIHKKEEESD